MRQLVRSLGRIGERATHQVALLEALLGEVIEGPIRPAVSLLALGPRAAADRPPLRCRQIGGVGVDPIVEAIDEQPLLTRDGHDVAQGLVFEESAELRVAAVHLVRCHPTQRQLSPQEPPQHHARQPRLGGEATPGRDSRLAHPLGFLGPRLGQVEFTIHQGVPLGRSVSGEHADLAVLDPAPSTAARHPPTCRPS